MSLRPFFRLLRERRLTPLLRVGAHLKSFYRLTYLAAAAEAGLVSRPAIGPATLDSLAGFCAATGQGREALEAWLQMGVRLRLLSLGARGYTLRGLATALARPEKDAVLAMVQEVAALHNKLISATLPKLRSGELWTLADQDGGVPDDYPLNQSWLLHCVRQAMAESKQRIWFPATASSHSRHSITNRRLAESWPTILTSRCVAVRLFPIASSFVLNRAVRWTPAHSQANRLVFTMSDNRYSVNRPATLPGRKFLDKLCQPMKSPAPQNLDSTLHLAPGQTFRKKAA